MQAILKLLHLRLRKAAIAYSKQAYKQSCSVIGTCIRLTLPCKSIIYHYPTKHLLLYIHRLPNSKQEIWREADGSPPQFYKLTKLSLIIKL